MKIQAWILMILLAGFGTGLSAQTIEIGEKLMTYTRPEPISEYKKTFTVNRPVVKVANGVLAARIQAAISYEAVMDFDVVEEQTEIQWLDEADFTVDYNKNGILSISLTMMGSAAYPDGYTRQVVVNSKTGGVIKPADVFTNLAGIVALVQVELADEVQDTIAENAEAAEYLTEAVFEEEDLAAFSVAEQGVVFHYDYGFPHVILAWEPMGEFLVSWQDLKPFIKPTGLFGQFAR